MGSPPKGLKKEDNTCKYVVLKGVYTSIDSHSITKNFSVVLHLQLQQVGWQGRPCSQKFQQGIHSIEKATIWASPLLHNTLMGTPFSWSNNPSNITTLYPYVSVFLYLEYNIYGAYIVKNNIARPHFCSQPPDDTIDLGAVFTFVFKLVSFRGCFNWIFVGSPSIILQSVSIK